MTYMFDLSTSTKTIYVNTYTENKVFPSIDVAFFGQYSHYVDNVFIKSLKIGQTVEKTRLNNGNIASLSHILEILTQV